MENKQYRLYYITSYKHPATGHWHQHGDYTNFYDAKQNQILIEQAFKVKTKIEQVN